MCSCMTELKYLYHALLKKLVQGQLMLVPWKDGQIANSAFLILDAILASTYLFWYVPALFIEKKIVLNF